MPPLPCRKRTLNKEKNCCGKAFPQQFIFSRWGDTLSSGFLIDHDHAFPARVEEGHILVKEEDLEIVAVYLRIEAQAGSVVSWM